ncbi:MAG TPA: SIMPL domain-containing protein, partial [Planctomycetota bacterium]|nr:SIMPL domain-containing protein [Planctomycetota bacterium]
QQLSFGLSNDTEHRLEALRNSVAEARSKARAMADALGYDLKGVHAIREGGYHFAEPRFQAMDARGLAMEAATPVEPGQVEIQASVTIEYVIAPAGDEPRSGSRDTGRRERLGDPAPEERGARDPSPAERAERGSRAAPPRDRGERRDR